MPSLDSDKQGQSLYPPVYQQSMPMPLQNTDNSNNLPYPNQQTQYPNQQANMSNMPPQYNQQQPVVVNPTPVVITQQPSKF